MRIPISRPQQVRSKSVTPQAEGTTGGLPSIVSRAQVREGAPIGPGHLRRAAPLKALGPRQNIAGVQARLDQRGREARYPDVLHRAEMPPASKLDGVVDMAKMANFVYFRDPEKLPGDFKPAEDLMSLLATELNLPTGNQLSPDKKMAGTVADPKSGLVASILVDHTAKRVVLAFGGTTAGEVPGGASQRVVGDASMGGPQWLANGEAGLGVEPESYKQAATLAQELQLAMTNGHSGAKYHDYDLSLTGHSKGGGEASYAAIMMEKPVKATVFSPAPLSDGLLDKAREENVKRLPDLVKSFSVKGDPVPELGDPEKLSNKALKMLGLPHPRSVGTAHVFEPDPHLEISDPVDRVWPMFLHDLFLPQLESHQRQGLVQEQAAQGAA